VGRQGDRYGKAANTLDSFSEPLILRARSARKIKGSEKLSSNFQYELQSGEFAPEGRELSALKPENSPPLAGCFRAVFQNENC